MVRPNRRSCLREAAGLGMLRVLCRALMSSWEICPAMAQFGSSGAQVGLGIGTTSCNNGDAAVALFISCQIQTILSFRKISIE